MGRCRECGAPENDGRTCRGQWDELLALEFSDVRAGSVHFLTVVCYQLQHPRTFRLHTEARRDLARALGEVVVHSRPISSIRAGLQHRYDGARSVSGPPADPPVRDWSRTVTDVGPPDPQHHAERVRGWAAAVYADLDRIDDHGGSH
jgi:hypothetical protein